MVSFNFLNLAFVLVLYLYLEQQYQLNIIRFCQFFCTMLAKLPKQVIDLKKVITGNLKF